MKRLNTLRDTNDYKEYNQIFIIAFVKISLSIPTYKIVMPLHSHTSLKVLTYVRIIILYVQYNIDPI